MTATKTIDLLALAERCEKATGPDRELDAAIASAFSNSVESDDGDYWWGPHDATPMRVPAFTASLDAAMTLVPEGANFVVVREGGAVSASVPLAGVRQSLVVFATTPALALCSAALRAMDASNGKGENQ